MKSKYLLLTLITLALMLAILLSNATCASAGQVIAVPSTTAQAVVVQAPTVPEKVHNIVNKPYKRSVATKPARVKKLSLKERIALLEARVAELEAVIK
jgi:hypothetical protein